MSAALKGKLSEVVRGQASESEARVACHEAIAELARLERRGSSLARFLDYVDGFVTRAEGSSKDAYLAALRNRITYTRNDLKRGDPKGGCGGC